MNTLFSPKLHNYWIKENNLDAIYGKLETNENDLLELSNNLKSELNGLNVTVPFLKRKSFHILMY